MIHAMATYKLCLVCGRVLIPQQFALVSSDTPNDIENTILANESCPECWQWAWNDAMHEVAGKTSRGELS